MSACFSHAYTSLVYGVYEQEIHALLSKRLRYIYQFILVLFLEYLKFKSDFNKKTQTSIESFKYFIK